MPLQGLALPAEVWERDVLPRRVGAYSPTWMDQLCASGELVWIGAGALGRNSGGSRCTSATTWRCSAPAGKALPCRHSRPTTRCASGWPPGPASSPICSSTSSSRPRSFQEALWDLAWAGEATNDAFAPLRAPRLTLARAQRELGPGASAGAPAGSAPPRGRRPPAQVQGRWSLTAPLLEADFDPAARRRALAELLLERYGILTREQVLAEGVPAGSRRSTPSSRSWRRSASPGAATSSRALGGAQFALPGRGRAPARPAQRR